VLIHDVLKAGGHAQEEKEICHNFMLSVRAERRDNAQPALPGLGETGRLMRVRWEGERILGGTYDPRSKLIASLEFDRSMKGIY